MAFSTEKICIEEVSFEDYQRLKARQRLRPPQRPKGNTLYGEITETISITPERLSRDVLENLQDFQRVNGLYRHKEESGFSFLRRFAVYTPSGFKEDGYCSPQALSVIIREGRGIDLVLKGRSSTNSQEKHFYRILGESLVLVQVQVPIHMWVHYKFRKNSGHGFNRLEATFVMPDRAVKGEQAKRNS